MAGAEAGDDPVADGAVGGIIPGSLRHGDMEQVGIPKGFRSRRPYTPQRPLNRSVSETEVRNVVFVSCIPRKRLWHPDRQDGRLDGNRRLCAEAA